MGRLLNCLETTTLDGHHVPLGRRRGAWPVSFSSCLLRPETGPTSGLFHPQGESEGKCAVLSQPVQTFPVPGIWWIRRCLKRHPVDSDTYFQTGLKPRSSWYTATWLQGGPPISQAQRPPPAGSLGEGVAAGGMHVAPAARPGPPPRPRGK